MNTNSTDFACLVTGFLTDYLPHHRCYSKNTILSYRDDRRGNSVTSKRRNQRNVQLLFHR